MHFDRTQFFDAYAAAFGALKPSARGGLDALLAAVEADPDVSDVRWLAYMFATVKHECAGTWLPIEEYGKGKGRKYGVPVTVTDPQGRQFTNVYYGRGYVQLTWDYNYRGMGNALNNRLLYEPELALNADVAYRIMSHGMRRGSFTGRKLADYINAEKTDYVNARKIINGLDKAELIAGYAVKLEAILRGSAVAAMGGVPVMPPTPAPAAPTADDGVLFTVTASRLNVRATPDGAKVASLLEGTTVRQLARQGEWARVEAQDHTEITGWVSAEYLARTAPAAAAPTVTPPAPQAPPAAPAASPTPAPALFTVTASRLRVRKGPGADSPILAGSPLPAGTLVLGGRDEGDWKLVTVQGEVNGYPGLTGWVSAQYLAPAVPAAAN